MMMKIWNWNNGNQWWKEANNSFGKYSKEEKREKKACNYGKFDNDICKEWYNFLIFIIFNFWFYYFQYIQYNWLLGLGCYVNGDYCDIFICLSGVKWGDTGK